MASALDRAIRGTAPRGLVPTYRRAVAQDQRSIAVPVSLRLRRAVRRLPPVRAVRLVGAIIRHPANQGNRLGAVRRSIWWQVRSRLRRESVDIPLAGGLSLRCYPRSNAASNVIYFTERHDPVEMALIDAVVRPGDTVVDAGANIGTYTLPLARLVGPDGRVVAIEPSPLAARRLQENIVLNRLPQVDVVTAAVGRTAGQADMSVDMDVSNSLAAGPGSYRVEPVSVVTLDSLVAGERPSLVKLDVEGYEEEALHGASAVLSADDGPVVLIEITDHLLRRAGSSGDRVIDLLRDRGYVVRFPVLGAGGRVSFRDDERTPNAVAMRTATWRRLDPLLGQLTV